MKRRSSGRWRRHREVGGEQRGIARDTFSSHFQPKMMKTEFEEDGVEERGVRGNNVAEEEREEEEEEREGEEERGSSLVFAEDAASNSEFSNFSDNNNNNTSRVSDTNNNNKSQQFTAQQARGVPIVNESRDFNSQLVQEVSRHPALFDFTCEAYKSIDARNHHWDEVSAFVGQPLEFVRTRWKTLRDRFKKEIRRVQQQQQQQQTENPVLPGGLWQHYEEMLYLMPFVRDKLEENNYGGAAGGGGGECSAATLNAKTQQRQRSQKSADDNNNNISSSNGRCSNQQNPVAPLQSSTAAILDLAISAVNKFSPLQNGDGEKEEEEEEEGEEQEEEREEVAEVGNANFSAFTNHNNNNIINNNNNNDIVNNSNARSQLANPLPGHLSTYKIAAGSCSSPSSPDDFVSSSNGVIKNSASLNNNKSNGNNNLKLKISRFFKAEQQQKQIYQFHKQQQQLDSNNLVNNPNPHQQHKHHHNFHNHHQQQQNQQQQKPSPFTFQQDLLQQQHLNAVFDCGWMRGGGGGGEGGRGGREGEGGGGGGGMLADIIGDDEEDQLFCRLVLKKLGKLEERLKETAKVKIMELLIGLKYDEKQQQPINASSNT